MTTGNLWSYGRQSLAGLRLLTEVSIGYKKSLVKTLLKLYPQNKRNGQMCAHSNIFLTDFFSKIF